MTSPLVVPIAEALRPGCCTECPEAPDERIKDHRLRSEFGPAIARAEFEWFTNRCDALIHERAATRTLHPVHATTTTGSAAHRQARAYVTRDLKRGPKWYGDEPCDDPKAVASQVVSASGYLNDDGVTTTEPPTSHADYLRECAESQRRTIAAPR